ncbi:MAG: sodium:solute symporter family protein [Deltaproteobacteria bacterium]|nr:sodium:solute symporter family protein [Deltaproteobacteria bacterium]
MDTVIVLGYLLVILALGLWAGRGIRTLTDYSVVGRAYGAPIIFATLAASFIGGGFSLGNAEKVFRFGIVNILALWGFSLKEMLVGLFIAPRMDRYRDAISVGDIMERHYGTAAKVFTGLFAIILCSGILGAQVGAMGYIFNVFLGIPCVWGMMIGCGIVIAYSTVGGMKSVVVTDIVQFVVLAIGIPLTLIMGIIHVGGIEGMGGAIPAERFSCFGELSLTAFLSLFLTFLLGETLVPPYVQRLLIGKDARNTATGTFYSGVFSIPFFAVTGGIGLVAYALNAHLDPNLAMPYVIKEVLPFGIRGVVIAGVISIVMSSADSFLNAAAISCVNDVIKPLRAAPMGARQELGIAKVINLLTGTLAVFFAVKIESILDILIYSYNFWAPIIVVPLAAVILGVPATTRHFAAGAIGGIMGALIWHGILHNPLSIDSLVAGTFCNMAAFWLSYRLFPRQEAGEDATSLVPEEESQSNTLK